MPSDPIRNRVRARRADTGADSSAIGVGEDGGQALARARPARLGGHLRTCCPRRARSRLRKRPLHAGERPRAARPRSFLDRRSARGDPLRHPPRQSDEASHNVRFAVKDVQTFLRSYVGEGTIAEIHLYHPQPYHDPRKAHLRVMTPEVFADVHGALAAAGVFVVQTDNPDYWRYIRKVLPSFFDFQRAPRSVARRPRRPHPPRDRGTPARTEDLPRNRHPPR